MFRKSNGQISILGLLGVGTSIMLSGIGFYVAQIVRTDSKIEKVNVEITADKQRIAVLEEAIKTIKDDNGDIKEDIKEILKILR